MDTQNRFHTDSSFRLVRAEAVLGLLALVYLLLAFASDVNWSRFLVAFALVDLVGYLPGALAFRRALARRRPADRTAPRIAARFHHLYNLTHSFLTCGVVLGLWFVASGDVEWAMLALPLHLLGDRGLFGNTYKPSNLPFEPWPRVARDPSTDRDFSVGTTSSERAAA